VNKNPMPARVLDNLYYLGSGTTGPWAIDTSEGIILVDAMNNREEAEYYIVEGLRMLGLDPSRLKVLIISHGHGDHYGGAAYLQEEFGMSVYLSQADWELAQRSSSEQRPAPKYDRVAVDGETITLGDVSIEVIVTPGHTPGSLSLLIPLRENGEPRLVAHFGGVTNRNLSPEMHDAFDQSHERLIDILADARPDGYISSHPNYDDAVYRLALMDRPNVPNPFLIGTEDTLRFLQIIKECNLNNADIEAVIGTQIPGGGGAPNLRRD
jgi:metallo-beta-lactamase class B